MKTVETATDTGAENRTEEGAQRPKTAREEMMERIDERNEQALNDQIQQHAPATEEATEDAAVLVDDPKRFKLRVKTGDGEEERSLDTVVNELQTMQGRMRSFSQREKDLEAALAEKERMLEAQLAAQALIADPEATDEEIDARVSEVMNALVEGDEEKGAAALREILKKGRQSATPVDENQLIGKVKAELKQEREQEQSAQIWESFVAEHPEFREKVDPDTGDSVLSEERKYGDYLFERDYKRRVTAGEISYQEALTQTAEGVRKVFAEKTPEPQPKNPLEERLERKKQLDQLPVAASSRAPDSLNNAQESTSDVIAEMRKKRGLPE